MPGFSRMLRQVSCARNELPRRLEHRRGLIAVRRMPACGKREQPCTAHGTADARDLLHRAVFVLLALDGEDRTTDRGQQTLDVPAAEFGIEPNAIPTPECRVDVGV